MASRGLLTSLVSPLLALAALAAPARAQDAEQLTIIATRVEPLALGRLGGELSDAIQTAVSESARHAAFNTTAIDPSEVILMFGCVQLDAQCAHQAARDISDGALYSRLTGSLEGGLDVRLSIIDASSPTVRRGLVRTIRGLGDEALPTEHLRPIFRYLARRLLSDQSTEGAEIYLVGESGRLYQRPVEAHTVYSVHRGRQQLEVGPRALEFDVRDGEVVLIRTALAAPGTKEPAPGYRVGAWMATGVSIAGFSGGLLLGHQMRLSEDAYLRAKTRAEAREQQTRGENQALAANVLFGVAAVSAITAVALFLLD